LSSGEVGALIGIFGTVLLLMVMAVLRYMCKVKKFNALLATTGGVAGGQAAPTDDGETFDEPVQEFHELARGHSKRSLKKAKEGAKGVDYRRSLGGKPNAKTVLTGIDEEFEQAEKALGLQGLGLVGGLLSTPTTQTKQQQQKQQPGQAGVDGLADAWGDDNIDEYLEVGGAGGVVGAIADNRLGLGRATRPASPPTSPMSPETTAYNQSLAGSGCVHLCYLARVSVVGVGAGGFRHVAQVSSDY
jgi:hypothetical protein